jgi:hypothetical protein
MAIDQLVQEKLLSLMVTQDDNTIGILRWQTFLLLYITPWRNAVFNSEYYEGTERTFRPDRTMRQH